MYSGFFYISLKTFFFVFLVILVTFSFSNKLVAEKRYYSDIELLVSVNKNQITIGEKILLYVTLKQPMENNFQLSLLNEQIGSFEVIDYILLQPTNRIINGKNYNFGTIQYHITTYTSGPQTIPVLKYQISNQTISSEPISIQVKSVLTSDENSLTLSESKPNLLPEEKVSLLIYFIPPLGLLTLLFIGYIFIRWLLRIKQKPYYDLAEQEINRLLGDGDRNILNKKFYFILDKIIKHFFAHREHKHNLLAMTSKQLKQYFFHNKIKKETDFIYNYVDYTDIIKFSHKNPDPVVTQKIINDFKKIISETREQEQNPKK